MTDFIAYPSCQSREVITLCQVLRRSQGKPNREMETSLRREGELYLIPHRIESFTANANRNSFCFCLLCRPPSVRRKILFGSQSGNSGKCSKLDRGSKRSSPRYGLSIPYRLTVLDCSTIFLSTWETCIWSFLH